jgi:hypothetical protein
MYLWFPLEVWLFRHSHLGWPAPSIKEEEENDTVENLLSSFKEQTREKDGDVRFAVRAVMSGLTADRPIIQMNTLHLVTWVELSRDLK